MKLELKSTSSKVDLDDMEPKNIISLYDNALRVLTDTEMVFENNNTDVDVLDLESDAKYIKNIIETKYAEHLVWAKSILTSQNTL